MVQKLKGKTRIRLGTVIIAVGILIILGTIYLSPSLIEISLSIGIFLILLVLRNIIVQKGDFSSRNVKFWIMFLLISFAEANLILFYIYQQSHQGIILPSQIWGYFESGAFKVVSASIISPLILFLLENIFKIRERRDERYWENRIETIKKTQEEFLNDFSILVSKVCYFNKKDNNNETIEDIISELFRFTVSSNHIIILWETNFKSYIKKEDIDVLVDLINYLILSAVSVANYIRNDYKEYKDLQDALEIIADQFIQDLNPHISRMLNYVKDIEIEEPKDQDRVKDAIKRIKSELKHIRDEIKEIEREYNAIFPCIKDDDELLKLRNKCSNMEEWHHNNPEADDEEIRECMHRQIVIDCCKNIPYEKRMGVHAVPYSPRFIKKLANYLCCEHYILHEIKRRSRGTFKSHT